MTVLDDGKEMSIGGLWSCEGMAANFGDEGVEVSSEERRLLLLGVDMLK